MNNKNKNEISQELKNIVNDVILDTIRKDDVKIEDTSDIVRDLGCDSLDMVQIAIELEQKFNITVEEEDIEKLKTVGDLYNYVYEKTKKKE